MGHLDTKRTVSSSAYIIPLVLLLVMSIIPVRHLTVTDFMQDYAAAWGALHGYSANAPTDMLVHACCQTIQYDNSITQTAHPPSATLIVLPLTLLPWEVARWVWLVLSWLIIAVSWIILRLPSFVCLVTVPYWSMALAMGTFEPIIFGLLAIAVMQAENNLVAGIVIGIAIALKIYPIFVVLTLVLSQRWRAAIIAGITTVIFMLFAEIGVHATYGWLQYVPKNTNLWVDVAFNYSLVGTIRNVLPGASPFICAMFIALIFTLPLIPRLKKGDIQILMPVILLANPLVWANYLCLLSTRPIGRIEGACFFATGTFLWVVAVGVVQSDGLAPIVVAPILIPTLLIWYKDVKELSQP